MSNTVFDNGIFSPLTITQTLFFHFLAVSLPECFSKAAGVNISSGKFTDAQNQIKKRDKFKVLSRVKASKETRPKKKSRQLSSIGS